MNGRGSGNLPRLPRIEVEDGAIAAASSSMIPERTD